LIFSRCHKEKFITDSAAMLEFSNDSILFDTVFSTIGSTTQYFHVYNKHNETIVISDVHLESGSGSQYRFNIDGVDGPIAENIEILPNDSIWLFVEVTVDPGSVNVPFIVEDLLVFNTNGNIQTIVLNAWGRDAFFHGTNIPENGTVLKNGIWFYELDCDEVWTNEKPHVIYGPVMVLPGCTLTINPGVEVYVHGKSGIWVNGGTLIAGEEFGEIVTFQGDRLEPEFASVPGQWGIQFDIPYETGSSSEVSNFFRGGIWIQNSPGSTITNCELRNGNMGIWVDSTGTPYDGDEFSVTIRNTKILNMAGIGLMTQNATVKAQNVLSGNCGEACAYFSLGGRYHVDNCTFANYWAGGARTAPAFALNNYYVYTPTQTVYLYTLQDTHFRNCIMFGNSAFLTDFSEFVVDLFPETILDQTFEFKNCLVDANVNVDNDGLHYFSMSNNQAPYLCNPAGENFKISNNPSLMIGAQESTTPFVDIDGNSWSGEVNKGCYKFTADCE
jgi:parallel beta-helix repeat protein